MPVIEFDAVSKWYGEVIGLNNVTFTIEHGITGLVGPNGAGKTTLMSLATGQLRPNKGSVRVLGGRVWNNPAVLAQIGYCPDGDRFWPPQTGLEFVRFLVSQSGLQGATAKAAALEAIEATGMTEHMHRAIRGYSKGMRQRIKVAQALAHRPPLLILDEPFTGADPVARHQLASLLKRLAGDGVDVLISSHVLHEVEALTRQILMIDHGRIVAGGNLQVIRRQMRHKPHAIRVRVDQPRRIAAGVVQMESVVGIQMSDGNTLVIQTTAPNQVYDRLTEIIIDERLTVWELAAADESLEAVFGYLTDRSV